jgi:hypothetical protein
MKTPTPSGTVHRRDRLIEEQVHDTYKLRGKLKEPTRCPQCGAVYHKGRWSWAASHAGEADEQICTACHRINDNYPAGELTLSGRFAAEHKDELLGLVRNIEDAEKTEHPMNRVIGITQKPGELLVTTTDVHLPRRIGKAIEDAWEGALDIHFDEHGYFTRVAWKRDD